VNFDRVARHYRWLETLVFGNRLQEARVAFIGQIRAPRRVLIAGEGNGRFLGEFVRAHPAAEIDCIEASARMIALARRRVESSKVRFIQADLRAADLEPQTYDLIVTHFVLDCFDEQSLPSAIEKLARAATLEAQWMIAEFCEPVCGWQRFQARLLIAIMYRFFRVTAGIEARHLVDYKPLLGAERFVLEREVGSPNEMICSQLWRRGPFGEHRPLAGRALRPAANRFRAGGPFAHCIWRAAKCYRPAACAPRKPWLDANYFVRRRAKRITSQLTIPRASAHGARKAIATPIMRTLQASAAMPWPRVWRIVATTPDSSETILPGR
jgi:ubiquinone/menaquinone biosynthesis C-methylase UbiE